MIQPFWLVILQIVAPVAASLVTLWLSQCHQRNMIKLEIKSQRKNEERKAWQELMVCLDGFSKFKDAGAQNIWEMLTGEAWIEGQNPGVWPWISSLWNRFYQTRSDLLLFAPDEIRDKIDLLEDKIRGLQARLYSSRLKIEGFPLGTEQKVVDLAKELKAEIRKYWKSEDL
jgi:hypothetical protein